MPEDTGSCEIEEAGARGPRGRAWRWVVLMLLASVLSRAYMLGYPPVRDGAIWAYGGRGWFCDGLSPYEAIFDAKPPGIFLIYGIAWKLAPASVNLVRILSMLAVFATGWLLFALTARLSESTLAGGIAGLGYILWCSSSGGGDAVSSTDLWVALWAAASMSVVFPGVARRRSFLGGVLAGCCPLFKQTGIIDFAAVLAVNAIGGGRRERLRRFGLFLGGALILAAATVAYFGAIGDLKNLWEVVVVFAVHGGYRTMSRLAALAPWWPFARDGALLLAGAIIAGAKVLPGLTVEKRRALWTWLLVAAISPISSGPRYSHSTISFMAPIAVLGGLGLAWAIGHARREKRARRTLLIALGCLLMTGYAVGQYPSVRRGVRYLVVGAFPNEARAAGEYIAARTGPQDTIMCPDHRYAIAVYLYADRRAPSRFTNLGFEDVPIAAPEIAQGLRERPPAYFVFSKHDFPGNPADVTTQARQEIARFVREGPYRRINIPGAQRMFVYERIERGGGD